MTTKRAPPCRGALLEGCFHCQNRMSRGCGNTEKRYAENFSIAFFKLIANQIIKRAQGCIGTRAHGNDDLFVRAVCAIACRKYARNVRRVAIVDDNFAERFRSTVPSSHSVFGTSPIWTNTPCRSMWCFSPVSRSI